MLQMSKFSPNPFFDVEKNKFVFIILKAGQNTPVHLVVTHNNRVFHKLDKVDNNANIGIRGFNYVKKYRVTKFCPQWE